MLWHQPREVCGSAECAAVDLGEGEDRVVGSDDHVRVADESDTAADTESVDGHDDGYSTVVDGREGRGATAVGGDQRVESLGGLHLLDVDAGVESASLGSQDHHVEC